MGPVWIRLVYIMSSVRCLIIECGRSLRLLITICLSHLCVLASHMHVHCSTNLTFPVVAFDN